MHSDEHGPPEPSLRPQSYFNLDLLKWRIIFSVLLDLETEPAISINRHSHSRCWGLGRLSPFFLKHIPWQPHVRIVLNKCSNFSADLPLYKIKYTHECDDTIGH